MHGSQKGFDATFSIQGNTTRIQNMCTTQKASKNQKSEIIFVSIAQTTKRQQFTFCGTQKNKEIKTLLEITILIKAFNLHLPKMSVHAKKKKNQVYVEFGKPKNTLALYFSWGLDPFIAKQHLTRKTEEMLSAGQARSKN